jgi:hypothetical protein
MSATLRKSRIELRLLKVIKRQVIRRKDLNFDNLILIILIKMSIPLNLSLNRMAKIKKYISIIYFTYLNSIIL